MYMRMYVHVYMYTQKNWKQLLKYLYTNVCINPIHSSQKVEKTQMSINKWTA